MDIDWESLFVPQMPLLEIVLRGTVMYLALFAVLRLLVRRHVGSMNMMDLLLMVLIADAAQNAMAGDYKTITEGGVLCATLIGWNYLLDWLAYLFPAVERLLEPPPLPIVVDGKLKRRAMRQELLSEGDVMSQLRQQGVTDLAEVKLAYVEPDGGVSIERADGRENSAGGAVRKKKRRSGL